MALENSMNQIFRDGWLDEIISEEYVTKSILDNGCGRQVTAGNDKTKRRGEPMKND